MAQQKKQIDEAIEAAQNSQLEKNAEEQNISLKEFDGILQPIIDSCTKDSISQGKYISQSVKINIIFLKTISNYIVDNTCYIITENKIKIVENH